MLTQQNREELETRGVTVVQNVVSISDCDRHLDYFRGWLSRFPEGAWPQSIYSLIQRYKTGYMPPTWEVRLNAKKVFAQIWGTEKLLSSIDAIAIGRPPEEGQEEFWKEGDNWLHVDQEAGRIGLHAYQGSVFLETCDEQDWTFEVIEGSHKYFAEFMETTDQFRCRKVTDANLAWFEERGCKRKRIPCPKGGMILWDSRTFHANIRPIQGRENPGRWRYVVFVSMGPASWASPTDLKFKKEAYDKMLVTTHWPCQGMKVFPSVIDKDHAADPGGLEDYPEIATTDEVKRLVGVLPYEEEDKDGENEPKYRPEWDPDLWDEFLSEKHRYVLNLGKL